MPATATEPEEDEDEDLAEAVVAVGPGPARVGDGADDGQHPEHQDGPAADDDQVQADQAGEPHHDADAGRQLALAEQPQGGRARRAHAVRGVGAGAEVEEVVGEVGGDLQQQRHGQRRQRREQQEDALADGHAEPDQDRPDRGRQRPRPDGQPPGAASAHGRRGYFGSRAGASPGRRGCPRGPLRSGRRASWRRRPAPGGQPGRRCRH